MRRILWRILYCLFIFFVSVVIFERLFYQEESIEITEMEQAVLPVINMKTGSTSFNVLFGYTDEVDPGSMEQDLTLFSPDRTVSFTLSDGGSGTGTLSYEVRSIGGERLVEAKEVGAPQEDGSYLLTFSDLLEEGEEYRLVLRAGLAGGGEARYYTRLRMDDGEGLFAEALNFAAAFHQATLDGASDAYFLTYLEPEATNRSANLAHVTIHSQVSDVTFGSLSVREVLKTPFSLRDRTGSAFVLSDWFVVEAAGEGDQGGWYACRETYRIQKGTERFHLMEYEREMTKLFDPEQGGLKDNEIPLGVCAENVDVLASPGNRYVAFTSGNSLYLVDVSTDLLVSVFGFRRESALDLRDLHDEHRVKILSVNDEGDVDFLVYGYMNRGAHEGKTGILFYHYSGQDRTLEEELFIRARQGFDLIHEEMEQAAYQGANGLVYAIIEDDLCEVDPGAGTFRKISENLREGSCVVSLGGRWIARIEETETGNALVVTDLYDRSKRQIPQTEGESLVPLGFLGDLLVYGVVFDADAGSETSGDPIRPMRAVWVLDSYLNPIGGYEQEGIFIEDCEMENGQITIRRLQQTRDEEGNVWYVRIADEHLSQSDYARGEDERVTTARVSGIGPVKRVSIRGFSASNWRFARPRRLASDGRVLTVYTTEAPPRRYLVYEEGRFVRSFVDPVDAITRVGSGGGYVKDESGRTVYRRARTDRCQMDVPASVSGQQEGLAACMEVLLAIEGKSANLQEILASVTDPVAVLEAATGNRAFAGDGLDLSQILYYPSAGLPVLIQVGYGGGSFLILGYGPERVALYNGQTHELELPDRSQIQNWLTQHGTRVSLYYR